MIALNNSVKSRDKSVFKQEVYQIIRDVTLRRVINEMSISKGIQLFGGYYVLLKFKWYKCIYFRYLLKFKQK